MSCHGALHNPASCDGGNRIRDQKCRTEHGQIGSDEGKTVIQVLELVVVDTLHHFKPGRENVGHLFREFNMAIDIIG